jgi:hypothetical protein
MAIDTSANFSRAANHSARSNIKRPRSAGGQVRSSAHIDGQRGRSSRVRPTIANMLLRIKPKAPNNSL